ncbi:HNH endonuclease [Salipiger bermudensis]|uniref:HNH endonuclease n=1 Tax=Salipiger bermudensis TaxID=344736 RepID=UPI001CD40EAA|nr:HNH endonuclease [Salipiger bermudensis]MCA1286258.1 HNH endonuclease [Salipiger bermudensis]
MPSPPRACSCGRVVPHGERCACQIASTRARNRRHDALRPSAAQRGYDHVWRRARLEFLASNPHCALCGASATIVDHVKAHRGDMELFWEWSNWQPLCKRCHDQAKQRLEWNQLPGGTTTPESKSLDHRKNSPP